ncbi:hypothetical protein OLP41_gp068 [Mycobacterium phage I3]|uniref:Uncharacterized protein n=1 Tax=Mycobacterium phage I3 TaxID=2994057 RepID=A0A8F2IWY3_9CAUD|nr:hypothetical protein OLP41_gp068 [Mycobacterium phage I3]QWT30527.1 hypothetical protein PBI_I3_68 [Mycobacterium phage I3]
MKHPLTANDHDLTPETGPKGPIAIYPSHVWRGRWEPAPEKPETGARRPLNEGMWRAKSAAREGEAKSHRARRRAREGWTSAASNRQV